MASPLCQNKIKDRHISQANNQNFLSIEEGFKSHFIYQKNCPVKKYLFIFTYSNVNVLFCIIGAKINFSFYDSITRNQFYNL